MSCPVVRRPDCVTRPAGPPQPPAPLSLAVVGDCELVVEGLVAMLEPFAHQVQVVVPDPALQPEGCAESGRAVPSVMPHVVLIDCYRRQPGSQVLVGHPAPPTPTGVRAVAYSWWARDDLAEGALEHGYAAFLGKSLRGPELLEALTCVRRGATVVRLGAAAELPPGLPLREVRWQECEVGLTPRETEVVVHVTAGHSNREIADALHLSINSLKSYIRTAYRKMGVTTRSQAVLWGRSHGLYLPERYVAPPVARRTNGVESP